MGRHRFAKPWSGHVPARVRSARPPRDEVEHGGLCSALITRRIRFDSWHLDVRHTGSLAQLVEQSDE